MAHLRVCFFAPFFQTTGDGELYNFSCAASLEELEVLRYQIQITQSNVIKMEDCINEF